MNRPRWALLLCVLLPLRVGLAAPQLQPGALVAHHGGHTLDAADSDGESLVGEGESVEAAAMPLPALPAALPFSSRLSEEAASTSEPPRPLFEPPPPRL